MKKVQDFGVTLIEVLIVLAIIIVMTIILIVAISPGDKLVKTRDVGRKSTLKQIGRALDRYYVSYGVYPFPCEPSGANTCASASGWNSADALVSSGELTIMPSDPINDSFVDVWQESGHSFYLITGTEGAYYILGAFMERDTDEEILANLPYTPLEVDCSTGIYYAGNAYLKTSYKCPEGATPAPTGSATPTPSPTPTPTPTPTPPPAESWLCRNKLVSSNCKGGWVNDGTFGSQAECEATCPNNEPGCAIQCVLQ